MSKEFLKVCAFQHKSPFSGMCSQSCTTLCDPVNYSLPGSSVHVIFQARIWSWLPFPTPRDLPNAGVEPVSLESPALAGRFFTTAPPGKPLFSGPSPYIAKWQVLKNEKLDEVWNATVLRFSNVIEKQCVSRLDFGFLVSLIHLWRHIDLYIDIPPNSRYPWVLRK